MTNKSFNGKDWPELPLQRLITKNSQFFKFGNKHVYVDIPNPTIDNIYREILIKCNKFKHVRTVYKCAKKFIDDANFNLHKNLEEIYGKNKNWESFFKIQIQRMNGSKKPLLFKYRIDWEKFQRFIENFPYSDEITLEDKYRYIMLCKYSGSDLPVNALLGIYDALRGSDSNSYKDFNERFNRATSTTVQTINDTLDNLISLLTKKLKEGKKNKYPETLLDCIPDMISTLYEIKILSNRGYISSCYRETRSLIERLSYAILDAYLVFNSFNYGQKEILLPLLNINSKWRDIQEKTQLNNIDSLFLNNIYNNQCEKYKIRIENALLEKMSVEMYVALGGKPVIEGCGETVPCLEIDKIRKGINEIINLADKSNPCWNILIREVKKKWSGIKYGEFPFPTTNFALAFLTRVFGDDLKIIRSNMWERYSLFIHPYIFTWEVIPSTSVIEYKIFEYELTKKIKPSIETLINSLFKYLNSSE